jgi:hypothetical protein
MMVSAVAVVSLAEIAEVRARIDRWRRSRAKRGAMPEELWTDAVALGERHGVYPMSQQLGLSYDRLKLRVVEAELERMRRLEERGRGHGSEAPIGFIELQAAQGSGVCEPSGPAVSEIELARADGARMTVRLADDQQLDLVRLSESFLGAGR